MLVLGKALGAKDAGGDAGVGGGGKDSGDSGDPPGGDFLDVANDILAAVSAKDPTALAHALQAVCALQSSEPDGDEGAAGDLAAGPAELPGMGPAA